MTAKGDWLNGDGYPTEACLKRVRAWDPMDFDGLARFLCEIWYWPELIKLGPAPKDGRMQLRMSTGGWSGNEDLVEAIPPQWHGMYFESHRRGDHWVFESLRERHVPKKPELPPVKMMYEGGEVVNPKPELPPVRVIRDGDTRPRPPPGPPVRTIREGDLTAREWRPFAVLVFLILALVAIAVTAGRCASRTANLNAATETAALCDDLIPECARILAGETPCKAALFECVDVAILQEQALQDISRSYGARLLKCRP